MSFPRLALTQRPAMVLVGVQSSVGNDAHEEGAFVAMAVYAPGTAEAHGIVVAVVTTQCGTFGQECDALRWLQRAFRREPLLRGVPVGLHVDPGTPMTVHYLLRAMGDTDMRFLRVPHYLSDLRTLAHHQAGNWQAWMRGVSTTCITRGAQPQHVLVRRLYAQFSEYVLGQNGGKPDALAFALSIVTPCCWADNGA